MVKILCSFGWVLLLGCMTYKNHHKNTTSQEDNAWNIQYKQIESGIKDVVISNYIIDIYPSAVDEDHLPLIQQAIKKAVSHGHGKIVFHEGDYHLKGPIHLENNLHLHLLQGAQLHFSDAAEDYLPVQKVRWEGTVAYNYSPLIYAIGKKNISITGEGTINGNGQKWSDQWRKLQKPAQNKLRRLGNDQVDEQLRVFAGLQADTSYFLRPGLLQLFECDQVLIEGVTFKNSPFWTIHFPFTSNIKVRNVTVLGGYLNDDGIDPDSSDGVLIENCVVDTHDDAISIKAGRDQDAWHRPGSQNIIIRNCTLKSKTNAFCIGSEMSGGVKNVFVHHCTLTSKDHAINFKSNKDRGGKVSHIYIKNVEVDTVVKSMINFTTNYHSYRGNDFPPTFSDIWIKDINAKMVENLVFNIEGLENYPIYNCFFEKIVVHHAGKAIQQKHTKDIYFKNIIINGHEIKL